MKRADDKLIFSPTDLCIFMESPFASWMDRLYLEHPDSVTPDEVAEDQEMLMKRGIQHEKTFVEDLTRANHQVIEIPGTGDRLADTVTEMRNGTEIVYQGALSHGRFQGFSDFLARVDGDATLGTYHYEVWDTKLAKKAKPYYLIQLCCYSDMLEQMQGRRPEFVRVVLGTGETKAFRTDDFFYYYEGLKTAFLQYMDDFDPENQPAPEPGADHGKWQSHAEDYMERVDHLYRTANITKAQVKKLQASGVSTMSELATSQLPRIPGIQLDTYERLREQASLQIASVGKKIPEYRMIPPNMDDLHRGLGLLPPPTPLDVFFDMEGYPLVDGGLEYLFGATYLEEGNREFKDWWAHDQQQEKAAFEGFVDWVHARWQDDPCMHVFHYAAYEISALRRLMGRYGTREKEVEHLLRNNVFVDLFTVVRQGVRVGEPSYSIKYMEHLYMEARDGDVTTSVGSIVFYERWLESGEPPDWREAPILKQIRDYNQDDCDSTHMLYEWLLERQQESGIGYLRQDALGVIEEDLEDRSPVTAARSELADNLLARAEARAEESPDLARIDELLGHVVEFHRREAKPVFWAMYDRAEMTEEELKEDVNCLGGLVRTADSPLAILQSTGFWYEFDRNQDTKISEGRSVFFAHDINVSPSVEQLDKDQGRLLLKLGPKALTQAGGDPPKRVSLIPDEYVRPEPIPTAVQEIVAHWYQSEELPATLRAFLFRERPSVGDSGEGALVNKGEDTKDAAIRLINDMDHTTLCLQGPPGTGKTRTASEAIVSLLKKGKRVAVTSNSHKAIFNLLRECGKLNGETLDCLKVGGGQDDPLFDKYTGVAYEKSATKAAPMAQNYAVVGGTAWLFSRSDLQGAFDYLFVDEAGQVSLANLVGMSRCADNVVLLGDQMQLAQPIQGSHPGDSGLSILDYYLEDYATMPSELGVFLGTSWRMHPSLCSFISGAVYEGQLNSGPGRENRVIVSDPVNQNRVTKDAGLLFVPVEHDGNTQGSEEEAAVVNEIVEELLQREHTDLEGKSLGKLTQEGILVVTPFNMQRLILQDLLPDGVRVGTVDKFQGQQAPVVIVSMCAIDGSSSSRGFKFLFERNRLNVALSRASSLAIIVGHPDLAQTPCNSVDKIALVNFYCRIVKEGLGSS